METNWVTIITTLLISRGGGSTLVIKQSFPVLAWKVSPDNYSAFDPTTSQGEKQRTEANVRWVPLGCMKATVQNPRGSVEKLSPKGKPKAWNQGGAAPKVLPPRVFPKKILREPSHCPQHSVSTLNMLLRGQFFSNCPKNYQQLPRLSKSWDYLPADWLYPPANWLYPSANWIYPPADWMNPLGYADYKYFL